MNAGDIRCEEVIEQLFRYLDREVDDATDERIREHMAHCRDCFSRAEFERRLRERLRESAQEKAPQRLQQRLQRLMKSF